MCDSHETYVCSSRQQAPDYGIVFFRINKILLRMTSNDHICIFVDIMMDDDRSLRGGWEKKKVGLATNDETLSEIWLGVMGEHKWQN